MLTRQVKEPPIPGSRTAWLRSSVWPLPAIAVTAIALAGYLFGWLGAVIVAGQTAATLLFVAGDSLLDRKKRTSLAVLAVAAGTAVVLALLWQAHAVRLAGQPKFWSNERAVKPGRPHYYPDAAAESQPSRRGVLGAARWTTSPSAARASTARSPLAARSSEVTCREFRCAAQNSRGKISAGRASVGGLAGAELNGANIAGADITGIDLPPSVMKTLVGKPAPSGTHVPSC